MQITLNYMGQLRHLAKTECEQREYADSVSLIEAIREAASGYDPTFAKIVFSDEGGLRPSVMVLVNDAPVGRESPRALSDGDHVTLITAIAGG